MDIHCLEATEAMRGVFANYVQQVIFDSWYTSAVEAKKTREYFEVPRPSFITAL